MEKESINQRIKFLVESLSDSVRAFSITIGEKLTNTSNYVNGRNKPSAEFLERIAIHFENVNTSWLLTGEGQPFKEGSAPTQNQTNISGTRNIVASGKGGKAILNNYNLEDCQRERDTLRADRDSLAKQVELLHSQLQTKDALIAAKDEMLDLLRGGFNRPN